MSRQVEIVDLLDDDDEPMQSSRSYNKHAAPPAARSREEQERLVSAVKNVQSKIDELRRMGAEIPRQMLDQFQALCEQLTVGTNKDDGASRGRSGGGGAGFSGGRGGGDGPSGRRPEPPPVRRPDPPQQPKKENPVRSFPQKPAVSAKADPKPAHAPPKPWNPARKARLLNRAARYVVPGVEAYDAQGRPLPPAAAKPGQMPQNVRGSLVYIPRMVDANLWYHLAARGIGSAFNCAGPFPDTVKGFPVNEGLDLSQADMPRDLSFNDPSAGDISEFLLDEDTKNMIDPRAVQEWENRTHPTKCTEKLAAQLREISAIQAVAVDCLKQQVAQLTTAFREYISGGGGNNKAWQQRNQEKGRIFNELLSLDQTVEDLDTTTAMVCNRSTVFFNLTSHASRKIMLDKLEMSPPTRHAMLHAPSARSLFTDPYKWVTLGPSLMLAKPGTEMKITDLGVFLKIGKLGDEVVAPSRDPGMPLPFIKYKKEKHMGHPPPPPPPSMMVPPPPMRDRPAQVQVPLPFQQPPPIFPAAAVLERERERMRREESPPWMDSPLVASRRDPGRPRSPPRASPKKSRRSSSPKRRIRVGSDEELRKERERRRSPERRVRPRSRSRSPHSWGRDDLRHHLEERRQSDLAAKMPPREDRSRRKSPVAHRRRSPSPPPPPPSRSRRRSPSPVAPRRRSPSPVAPRRRCPSPAVTRRRSPSPVVPRRRSPSPVVNRRRSPSPRRDRGRPAEPESIEKRMSLMNEIFDLLGQTSQNQKQRSPSPRRERERERARSPYVERSSGRQMSPLSRLLAEERAGGLNRPNPRY